MNANGTPLHNADVERALIGALLVGGGSVLDEVGPLPADVFYVTAHATVWRTAIGLRDEGRTVDAVTVRDRLREAGDLDKLDKAGGEGFLARLAADVPSEAGAADYARTVRRAAHARRVREVCRSLAISAEDPGQLDALPARVRAALRDLEDGVVDAPAWELDVVDMDEVEEREVPWLWEPYLAIGELTSVQGPPGMGKSQLCQYLAAQITKGGAMPGQDGAAVRVERGPVLWFSLEDHPEYVLKRRLREAGADDTMFKVVTGKKRRDADGDTVTTSVSLQDRDVMRAAFARYRPRLAVWDPLQAYLGPDKALNAAEDIRSLLEPLTALLREFGAAGALVRHMSKANMRTLLDSGMGSGDISAACRSVLAVGARSDDAEADRGMLHIKSNLGPEGAPLGYVLAPFRWTGPTDLARADLMGRGRREGGGKLARAVEFVERVLEGGPRPVRDLQALAGEAGHTQGTLERARKEARTATDKIGRDWWVCLPDDTGALRALKAEHEAEDGSP